MRSGRLISRLQDEFAKNPILKQKCITVFKKALKENDLTRCFNNTFPDFIEHDDIEELTKNVQNIADHAARYHTGTEVSYYIKREIKKFLVRLSEMACKELFNDHGHLKADLCTLMDIQPSQVIHNPSHLINAYLVEITPLVIQAAQESSPLNENFIYCEVEINQQIKNGVAQSVYQRKYQPTLFQQLENQVQQHPEYAVAGVGAVSGLLLLGGGLLAAASKQQSPDYTGEPDHGFSS